MNRFDRWMFELRGKSEMRRGAILGTLFGLLLIVLAFLACLIVLFIAHLGGH